MTCDDCVYYDWYYDWREKWDCEKDSRSYCDWFEEPPKEEKHD